MTTQYMEEGGFKKKFLAPLVVIMLCAVALAGAAYAYTTSVQGNGTVPNPDYYTIDLYTDGTATHVETETILADGNFDAYTTKTVGGTYLGQVDKTSMTFTTYVKVNRSPETSERCYIKAEVSYTANEGTTAMYDAWEDATSGITFEVKYFVMQKEQTEFTTGQVYQVVITANIPAIVDADLGTDNTQVIDNMKFNGEKCVTIKLTASEKPFQD